MSDNIAVPVPTTVEAMTANAEQEHLVEDLEQRIETLDNMEDDDFGNFTRLDYVILAVGAVVLPILAMILAR